MIIEEELITVAAIKPDMVDMLWPLVSPMIEMAIEHSNNELSLKQIKNAIIDEQMLLLVVYEAELIVATLTLERRDFDTGKSVINITTAGGADLHIWMDKVLLIIDELAREQGCDEVYIVGRAGWARALKTRGFRTLHTTVGRKVGEK
jgi:hypothetical protein